MAIRRPKVQPAAEPVSQEPGPRRIKPVNVRPLTVQQIVEVPKPVRFHSELINGRLVWTRIQEEE